MNSTPRALVLALAMILASCRAMHPPKSIPATTEPPAERLIDLEGIAEGDALLRLSDLDRMGRLTGTQRRPAVPPPRRTVLVLSGGGMFGAYTAGILCGWSETGTRPRFDVITGVSTGALVGCLTFPGPEYDAELRRFATQLTSDDVYKRRRLVSAIRSDSLADSTPLAGLLEQIVTPEYLTKVAREHACGRRFYVGTTHLDTGRLVVWNMGAIAARGTPESACLYRRVLLASAAIPGFFPAVTIPLEVNGEPREERHVDGGVTASLFARPPWQPPEWGEQNLTGSDLYVIVAGKLFPDGKPIPPRALAVARASISRLNYAHARDELVKLYAATLLTGMNYHVASLPSDFPTPAAATDFDPQEMSRLFEEGRREILTGSAWRMTPPGAEPGEEPAVRTGAGLVAVPGR